MRYTWKRFLGISLALIILLITVGCTSEQSPDDREDPTDFYGKYDENDPGGSGDWIDEDDLDAMKEAQEGLRDIYEGKFYTYGTMTPERQAYRLSCIREGINLSTNGGVGTFYQRLICSP